MLTLASYLSQNHEVHIFWDEPEVKAPLSKFLKIDLTKTKFVQNVFNEKILKRIRKSLTYSCIFVISDGSVPAAFARKKAI